ncbi:mechanosensitive ion channel family protein [Candidatus Parvarchaeota archaeon]|nr:mechanosensitive ion channel family protein [Candidatus Parvarchaeota archaeon]
MQELVYYGYLVALIGVSVVAGKALSPLFLWAVSRLVSKTKTTLDDRLLEAVREPVESFFFLFIFYLAIHAIPFFESSIALVERYTTFAITILATFLGFRTAKAFFNWYYEEGHSISSVKIDLSLLPLLQKTTQLVVILAGGIIGLGEIGFDITGILTFTSVIGIVIGLASQESLANIFAGLALQLDRQYHYGDYLRLPSGEIARLRKIGMRSSRLLDLAGNAIIISNSEFAKMRVTRVGATKTIAKASIAFEAPIGVGPADLLEFIKRRLSKADLELIESVNGLEAGVTKVKAPGWYEGSINFQIKDMADLGKITDRISRVIIERLGQVQLEKNLKKR